MDIDTGTIRRLRDALIKGGRLSESVASTSVTDARHQAAVERVSPLVEVMYLMMVIDGDIGDDERTAIQGAIKMLTDGMIAGSELDQLLAGFSGLVEQQGVEGRLQAIGNRICRDRLDRETAFTLAAAVAVADGKVVEEETLLVNSIAEWFGISSQRCKEILRVF